MDEHEYISLRERLRSRPHHEPEKHGLFEKSIICLLVLQGASLIIGILAIASMIILHILR